MATAFIRIKVDLPDEEAVRFVRDQRSATGLGTPAMDVRAKDIVDEVTAETLLIMHGSPFAAEYHAQITLAPR